VPAALHTSIVQSKGNPVPDEQREQEIQVYSWDCVCAELATLKPIRVVPATAFESAEKRASLLAARVEELERSIRSLKLRAT
jgi:hypothetical protein